MELLQILWRYMPVKDVRNVSLLNKKLSLLWHDPATWRFLLQRDFNIKHQGDDGKSRYEDALDAQYYRRIRGKKWFLMVNYSEHDGDMSIIRIIAANSKDDIYANIAHYPHLYLHDWRAELQDNIIEQLHKHQKTLTASKVKSFFEAEEKRMFKELILQAGDPYPGVVGNGTIHHLYDHELLHS